MKESGMKTLYKGKDLTQEEKDQIWEILCQCDDEFYPRLSLRDSSSQKDLSGGGTGTAQPVTYFREMVGQDFILAYEEETGTIAGFMTFKRDYICEAMESFGHSFYITTVCVRKELRGRGIMKGLYHCMETEVPQLLGCSRITTRTWSLNQAQLHELAKRGYRQLALLKDHRGPGVDTIYFGMEVQP